jgi:hypothetical protein
MASPTHPLLEVQLLPQLTLPFPDECLQEDQLMSKRLAQGLNRFLIEDKENISPGNVAGKKCANPLLIPSVSHTVVR